MYNQDDGVFMIGRGNEECRSNLLSIDQYGSVYISEDLSIVKDKVRLKYVVDKR